MKTSMLLILATLSLSAFAQTNPEDRRVPPPVQNEHPCFEFDQKFNIADQQAKDFDREMRKLDAKLRSIDDRISERTANVTRLVDQRNSLNDTARGLSIEQNNNLEENRRLNLSAISLRRTISDRDALRLSHIAQANAATNISIKREHLRASKQLEKEIGDLQSQLSPLDQQIVANNQRNNRIDLQLNQQTQTIADLNRQIDIEQRDPAVLRLQQERNDISNQLADSQITFDRLTNVLARAKSQVDMCYGYLELSVKYPAALKIARKVNKQGCSRYVSQDQGNELENQAQDDVLNTVCRQP